MSLAGPFMDQPLEKPNDEKRVDAKPERAEGFALLRSEDLLKGRSEVWIEHGDEMYRLRLTSAGKLYLTK